MDKNEMTAVIAVIISSIMFGALGVCTRYFHDDCGLSSIEIVLIRLTVSALALFIILALFDRAKLKIRKKDIPFMAFFGIFKQHHIGFHGEGACYCDPLLHTARQIAGSLVFEFTETHHLDVLLGDGFLL